MPVEDQRVLFGRTPQQQKPTEPKPVKWVLLKLKHLPVCMRCIRDKTIPSEWKKANWQRTGGTLPALNLCYGHYQDWLIESEQYRSV